MKGKTELLRKAIAIAALGGALAMLAVGAFTRHQVLLVNAEELAKDFDIPPPFEALGEIQLVIDSTFMGVVRQGGKLHSTYDRSVQLSKRPCPT